MPSNVIYSSGLRKYIRSYSKEFFSEGEVVDLIRQLSEGKLTSSFKNKYKHVQYAKSLQSPHKQSKDIKKTLLIKRMLPFLQVKQGCVLNVVVTLC